MTTGRNQRILLWTLLAWLGGSLVNEKVAALPAPPETHSCLGHWTGVGRNSTSADAWPIDLVLTREPDGGTCGTIEYRNPTCGGTMEACRRVGSEIRVVERFTHNRGCADAANLVLRCEGDTLRYTWLGWERVDSVLRRAQSVAGQPSWTDDSSSEDKRSPPGPGETGSPEKDMAPAEPPSRDEPGNSGRQGPTRGVSAGRDRSTWFGCATGQKGGVPAVWIGLGVLWIRRQRMFQRRKLPFFPR